MKNNNSIFFDGSNFYFKLKDLKLHDQLSFDFSAFNNFLGTHPAAVYYIGKIQTDKTKKSKKLHAQQRKLLAHLHKHQVKYSLGFLLKSGGKYHEKGVDVQIAVDILIGAYENLYDTCYLVSSDSDIIPAIKKARMLGKEIVYVGFKHKISYSLLHNCSRSILLTKEDLLPFCK